MSCQQEAGQEIMGMPASELKAIEDIPNSFDAALSAANFRPLIFNLRVAEDTYNDETRIKKSVNRSASLPRQENAHSMCISLCQVILQLAKYYV